MLYSRQEPLNLKIPTAVTIIGCGGIGSWIALDLALVGVKKLNLIDNDIIEKTNLNRTPYKTSQIGEFKVAALQELIEERRDIDIQIFTQKYEDIDEILKEKIKLVDYMIDCRDTVQPPIPEAITVGYDGFKFTIDTNGGKNVWGGGNGYETVPSFVGTPQFVASIFTTMIVTKKIRGCSGDLQEVISEL